MGGKEGGFKASGVDSETSEVGGKEGGREAYGVAENPGGGLPGSVRESRFDAGHQHPWSGKVAQGDKNTGIATKGEGVTGDNRRGRGSNVNPPTTQETREGATSGGEEDRTVGPGTAVLLRPQQGTTTVGDSTGTPHRHTADTEGVDGDGGWNPAARAPSARYTRGRQQGAETTRTVTRA